jgi:hypothetical protein
MCRASQSQHTLLSDHCIERHIMARGLDVLDPLATISQTDQQWPLPAVPVAAVGEQSIVISGARAQARTAHIKAQQWHEHDRQRARGYPMSGRWLRYTVTIAQHERLALAREYHDAPAVIGDARQIDRAVTAARKGSQGVGAHLVAD